MDNFSKGLVAIVLQNLDENGFHESARMLEQESGIFLNVNYLEEKVIAGEWEELEKYLLGFIKIDDNIVCTQMFLQIRRQKYLEALDRNDIAHAAAILKNDLKVFSSDYEDLYKELGSLMLLNDIREHPSLWNFVDAQTSRSLLAIDLKMLVKANPKFSHKLAIPSFEAGRLISLIKQRTDMQQRSSENGRPLPEVLFTDSVCGQINGAAASTCATCDTVGNLNYYSFLGVDTATSSVFNAGSSSLGRSSPVRDSSIHVLSSSAATAMDVDSYEEK